MSNLFYVDSTRCLTAFLNTAPDSRGALFALQNFTSIDDIISAAEQCYPLSGKIEYVYQCIWDSLSSIITDICGQDIAIEQEFLALANYGEPSDFQKLTDFVYLEKSIVQSFNDWLASQPDGEDWEHGDETVDGYRSAFNFFEENREEAEILGVEIIEGRRPGDNTQVAELRIATDEANKKAQAAGLDIILQDIE